MKFFDVEPRSQAWRQLRLGAVTSSCFHRIMTPRTLQISKQAPHYMAELIAEWLTGEELDGYQSEWMTRGQDVEDSIWKAYEAYAEVETGRGGYFCTDDMMIGASPDRLVGNDGLVECKAPMIQTQVFYAINGRGSDADYMCQLQGQLLVTERSWCEIFSWHPRLFIPPIRVERDEKFIAILRPVLAGFVETMLAAREKLEQTYGPFVRETPIVDGLGVSDEDLEQILEARREAEKDRAARVQIAEIRKAAIAQQVEKAEADKAMKKPRKKRQGHATEEPRA